MKAIELPKPPSVNTYWRHVYSRGKPHVYISEQGKIWIEEAGWRLKSQWNRRTIKGDVAIYVKLFYCGRYDIDNANKALFDLLTKMGVIEDDSQITFLQIEKIKVEKRNLQKVLLEIIE